MSTAAVIDEIKLKAVNWNRQGSDKSIAVMLNRAQNYLFSRACRESVVMDPETGAYPLLTTTAGEKKYDLPNFTKEIYDEQGNAQDVTLRFKMGIELQQTQIPTNEYGIDNILRRMNSGIKGTHDGIYVCNATFYEALVNRPAFVVLHFDPGATTEKYSIYGLLEPLQITNDTIPLSVSSEWEMALIDGALGFIEYHDYGRSDRLQTFYDVWANKYWSAYPLATNYGSTSITPIRNQ
jgi:hypothetical protein